LPGDSSGVIKIQTFNHFAVFGTHYAAVSNLKDNHNTTVLHGVIENLHAVQTPMLLKGTEMDTL
jgi:hypothetical protein